MRRATRFLGWSSRQVRRLRRPWAACVAAALLLGLLGEARAATITLGATARDFKMWNPSDPTTNPDFENVIATDKGIVTSTLGVDGTPVYDTASHPLGTVSTHGPTFFNQWYHDTPGVNI